MMFSIELYERKWMFPEAMFNLDLYKLNVIYWCIKSNNKRNLTICVTKLDFLSLQVSVGADLDNICKTFR